MIQLSAGLSNSLIALELLRNDSEFSKSIHLSVGTFTNCRECGLTFSILSCYDDNGEYVNCDNFTWCVYEHRNSDTIIINGKEGFVTLNGDLPYKADSKYVYLAEFGYGEYYQCAEQLKSFILEKRELAIAKNIISKEGHPAQS